MATITIYVSRNGNSTNLKLRDSEGHNPGNNELTTDVSPGDTVEWVLDENSGIETLVSVDPSDVTKPQYKDSINLLAGQPQKNGNVITGQVVSPSPGKGKFENYTISFTIPNDPTVYADDPKMQLNA